MFKLILKVLDRLVDIVLWAIGVTLLSALFGATVGFIFPTPTQHFMQYIKFETIAFWQLTLLVSVISSSWSIGSLGKTTTKHVENPLVNEVK